jgi:hypothetical protein
MVYQTTPVAAYRRRLRHEMIYRMIFVGAWAKYLDIQTQALRNLRIQVEKLDRLCSKDEFDYLFRLAPAKRLESTKHAQRIVAKRDKKIVPQYRVVLSYVEKVFQDLANHKGEGLTKAELRSRVRQFVSETESYAREHAVLKTARKRKVTKRRRKRRRAAALAAS